MLFSSVTSQKLFGGGLNHFPYTPYQIAHLWSRKCWPLPMTFLCWRKGQKNSQQVWVEEFNQEVLSLDYVFRGSTGASIKMFSNTGGFRIWAEAFFEDPTSNWVPEFQKDCERKYFSQDGISWRIRNVFEAVCNLEPFGNLKPFFAVKTSVSMA